VHQLVIKLLNIIDARCNHVVYASHMFQLGNINVKNKGLTKKHQQDLCGEVERGLMGPAVVGRRPSSTAHVFRRLILLRY